MFDVKYSVVINEDVRSYFVSGVASNEFIDKNHNKCVILHYLEVFEYKKNVNYKRIAKDCDEYFFYELVCAILRKRKNKKYTPCNECQTNCPPYCALDKCKSLLKKKFKK